MVWLNNWIKQNIKKRSFSSMWDKVYLYMVFGKLWAKHFVSMKEINTVSSSSYLLLMLIYIYILYILYISIMYIYQEQE